MKRSSKFFYVGIVCVAIIGAMYFSLASRPTQPTPREFHDGDIVTLSFGTTTIRAEVVMSPEARARGLSGREGLNEGEGMLFVFGEPGLYAFWMKDMRFAIDIVWLSDDWSIVGVEENVLPGTFPQTFSPPVPVRYVLEVGAEQNLGL